MATPASRPATFVTLKQLQERRMKEAKQREEDEEEENRLLRKAEEEKKAATTEPPPATFVTLRHLQELRLAEAKQRKEEEEEENRLRHAREEEDAATIRRSEEEEKKLRRPSRRRPQKPKHGGEIYGGMKSEMMMIKTDPKGKEAAEEQEKVGSSQREIEMQGQMLKPPVKKHWPKKHNRRTFRQEIRSPAGSETAAAAGTTLVEEKAIDREREIVESTSNRSQITTRKNEASAAEAEKKASEERIGCEEARSRKKWMPKVTEDEASGTTRKDTRKLEDLAAPASSEGGFGRAAGICVVDGERKHREAAAAAGRMMRGTSGRGRGGRGRKGSDAGNVWVKKPLDA